MRTRVVVVVALVTLASAPLVLARGSTPDSACSCPAAHESRRVAGVVWRGTDSLGLSDIASLTAPVLWFSPDEPLLQPGHGPIPSGHPCDTPAQGAVVYYQVTRLSHRGDTHRTLPHDDAPGWFDAVAGLTLRFFFYYPEDVGTSGHADDLEGADVEIALQQDGPCRVIRIVRVEGLAHGNRWYSNILDVDPDTPLPVTLLIERGKHATAPDRDADGRFERSDDVTRRRNDASGVGEADRQGARPAAFRLLPPEEPRLCRGAGDAALAGHESLGRYALRPANTVTTCEVAPAGTFLADMMAYHGFGKAHGPVQFRDGSFSDAVSRLGGPDQWLSLNLRGTGSRIGAALVVRGLDLGAGWLVPRLVVDGTTAAAEGLFTRSASRPVDLYVSAGAERQFETLIDDDAPVAPNWRMAIEGGVKLRVEIPRGLRRFVLGCNFGGVRLGARGTGFPSIDRWRFVWEIGVGAW